jgi:hypothetical protein
MKRWLPLLVIPLILGVALIYPVQVAQTNGLDGEVIESVSLTAIYHSVSPEDRATLEAIDLVKRIQTEIKRLNASGRCLWTLLILGGETASLWGE